MSVKQSSKPQALLIQLEFSTWRMARPWTYSANFAIREGLEANGVECHTIPAIPASSSSVEHDWLQHAERLCKGKRFDQVWVWLVHHEYDERFLEWIASLAPVRVGFVMESLSYSEEEHQFSPITRQRKGVVDHQLRYLTHAVVCDELDAQLFNAEGHAKAMWCPAFVSERFIVQQTAPAPNKAAVFHGTPYGHRKSWLEHPELKGRLISPTSQPTEIHRLFDQLHVVSAQVLQNRPADAESFLPQYLAELQRIRLAEFAQWMNELGRWACIVNLPGFQKGYGGRVYEAMAAGRPVISWDIPNRPRNRSLFEDGKDILLFPPDDPALLARHISRMLEDLGFAAQIATTAHHKIASHHSAEIRLRQILQWIESGIEPSFGTGDVRRHDMASHDVSSGVDGSEPQERAIAPRSAKPPAMQATSSPPAVSIIIPCFNQAHFLPEAVESVVNQAYGDWECIIVDDGSPDRTAETARQIITKHSDRRIRLIRKANGGLADARNAGIREGRGRYILPLDADDRIHPEYLQETVSVLERGDDVAIVYVDEQNFGETTHVHRKGISNLANLLRGNVHDYCTLYRRSVWEAVGGYSPAMYIGAEDWNFWIAAAKRGFRSFHVDRPLFLYRNRSGTMVEQVHKNVDVVKAHLIMHHPDLFTEAGRTQAQTILSHLSEENKEKLARVCAAHSDNELLKLFHRLAQGQTTKPEAVTETDTHRALQSPIAAVAAMEAEKHGDGHDHDDAYYANLFIKNPDWSTPEPNDDETARWVKIASFLEHIVRGNAKKGMTKRLRILDLGCGRGWLTSLASVYGDCTGIEPVSEVVSYARTLFPHIRFHSGTAETLLADATFQPFDIVLNSEVIEHVPRAEQSGFVQLIRRLVKPNGHVILTTPRGEVFDLWRTIAPPNQPIEDWLTENDIRRLFLGNQFIPLGNERAWIELPSFRFLSAPTPSDHRSRKLMPFYQVWAWQAPGNEGAPAKTAPFTPAPMVSVIVPTCNRPDRLPNAIRSIRAQTLQDFEIIVVNDGQEDVESVVSQLNEGGHITYIKHAANRGLAAARNTGLRVARGKYIAYLDDDDHYLPDHLETLVTCLEGSEYKAAYTDAWRVHERLDGDRYVEVGRDLPYSHEFNPANLLVSNYFPVLCVMHERGCLDDVGMFDEALFAHEDWDLWIRIATKFPFKHIKRTTAEFTWRDDGSSMTSGTQETYWRTTEIIYRKYRSYVESVPALLELQRQRLEELRMQQHRRGYDCSIVIPVHNNEALTRQCLEALAKITSGPIYEVIVVDNGSTDGTAEFLGQLGGDVQVIRNGENLGFAKACNQGAAASRGSHLVFLNNDTIPLEGWLSALVEEAASHPDTGIVGSRLLYPDRTIQHAGVIFDRDNLLPYHCYKGFESAHPAVSRRREFSAVTAACMLVRREVWNVVGGFDESYRNGFEDVDLCLKARKKGWKVIYQPASVVFHLEGKTEGRKSHDQENADRLFERWSDHWWLVDEDAVYAEDGYKAVAVLREGQQTTDLQLLEQSQDAAEWKTVAAVQRAAARQDYASVKNLLQNPSLLPRDPSVLMWAAEVCGRVGLPPLRLSYLRRVLEVGESPKVRCILAREALEGGRAQEAEQHLQRALETQPARGEAQLLLGVLHMQRERYADAIAAFTQAAANGADARRCRMGVGMASLGASRPEQAWDEFVLVLNDKPDDADAIHWLLRAGTASQRWKELAVLLDKFVDRNPGDLSARFAFAGVLLRAERIDEARREYETLRVLTPNYDGLSDLGRAITERQAVLTGSGQRA